MLHQLLERVNKTMGFETARAHCDIPCKIYDPITAQLATLSVLRFLDLINELEQKESLSLADQALFIRLVNDKEKHAAKVKDEVRIIWGDFIKQPQIEAQPDIHALVHNIMMAASACKQNVSREKGESLLSLVNQFAKHFWTFKGVDTYQAVCPYPPSEKLVYPLLKQD